MALKTHLLDLTLSFYFWDGRKSPDSGYDIARIVFLLNS
jgi:hypothetical protein